METLPIFLSHRVVSVPAIRGRGVTTGVRDRKQGSASTLRRGATFTIGSAVSWCCLSRRASRRPRLSGRQFKQLAASAEDMRQEGGRVAVVTGGTCRLGAATALRLAQSGKYDKVIIIGRDESKAQTVLEELQKIEVQAEFIQADLSSLKEVRAVCKHLKGTRLQCLVCTAGATALPERLETCDGNEYHFGLNFLSRFLMVNSLLDELSAAGSPQDPARVLLVGSNRHWGAPVLGFPSLGSSLPLASGVLSDMQFEAPGSYKPWEAFGQAALCNVMFAYELQRRLSCNGARTVAVSCFDPGPLDTAWDRYRVEENRFLANGVPRWLKPAFSYFTRLVERPEAAASSLALLATTELGALPCRAPSVVAGVFEQESLVPSKFPVPWSPGTSYDEAVWAELWYRAEALTELEVGTPSCQLDGAETPRLLHKAILYPWVWLWWHAPRSLASALALAMCRNSETSEGASVAEAPVMA